MADLILRNPATGEILGSLPITTAEETARAVAKARQAQASWGNVPPRDRGRQILRFRDAIRDHAEEIVDTLVRESGKVRQEALLMEVLATTDLITYYARRAHKILKRHPIRIHFYPTRRSYLHYVPRGVVAIISPWNFPLAIPIGQATMALLAGNAVVLKPSEYTPQIALLVKRLFDECGLPADLFQVIPGDACTGEALIGSDINLVVFTGSVSVGKKIAVACAERLIPVILELGGKAPAIVFEDADLERAVGALAWGGLANSGQVCASVERVYVQEGIHDALVSLLEKKIRGLRQGNPAGEVEMGAMVRLEQLEHVARLVESAVRDGAKVVCGGRRREGPGQFFEPTLLDGCPADSEILRREIFGPVLPVATFRTEEEALRLANDSSLGLVAYVFTEDRERGRRIAEKIEAGTVMVNDVLSTFAFPETPWHGVKESGLGVVHSPEGLKQMCQMRHVHYEKFRLVREEIWWYPYSEKNLLRFQRIYQWLYRWVFR